MSQLPLPVQQGVTRSLEKTTGLTVSVKNFSSISGGCINHGGKVQTSAGDFFVKWNDAKKFQGMFEAEAKGLKLLRSAKAIDIPEVIDYGQSGTFQFIILELKESRARKTSYWEDLGQQLATLHKSSNNYFGLDHNNYIGSLPQYNKESTSWVDFFIMQRLQVQVTIAAQANKVNGEVLKKFDLLYDKLPSLLIEEKPSLLHGDLWNGNLLVNAQGSPCLIDPAVYYGDREADLAMTQLFGGFDDAFYESYHTTFPLEAGYRQRFDIYNLYPLLVHVNLFGGSYLYQVRSILDVYV